MRRLISKLPAVALLLLISLTVFAQSRTVTGVITDATGAGIPGVTVAVKGSSTATQTNSSGAYTIEVPENGTLVFTAIGYGTQEISVTGNTASLTLQTAASNLNEVVVVGYGTARRRDVTGSVSSVRARDFNKGVQVAPDQLIQGKAAGVMVINNSGQPGGATTVRIRGTSSIRSGNQPLYVIDGVPLSGGSARPGGGGDGIGSTPGTNPLNFINPNDIASIEILKDASATAIYGSRGANGVILITTKKGSSGAPSLEVGASAGISNIMKRLEVLDAQEYRSALSKYGLTGGDYGGDVDALDAILRTAFTQNYNAAISGGNENGRYRVSASYLRQEGIVRESELKKYTTNLTSNFRLLNNRKLGLDFNILVTGTNERLAPISNDAGFTGSLIGQALQWNPTHPLRKMNDSIWIDNQIGNTTVNPLAMLEAHDDRANENTILASVSPSYKILSNLEYRTQFSITRRQGVRRFQLERWINIDNIRNRGSAGVNNAEETTQQITNTLNFNNEFSSNFNLNAVVGHEYLRFDARGNGIRAQDFPETDLYYYNFLGYSTQNSRSIYSYASPVAELQSFFGRAIMNFMDKYLLTATLRADGSSKFGENNKYGLFPSVAVAWNVSNEDFLQNNSFTNNLKFRIGWGKTGNQEFPSGASLRRFAFGQQSVFQVAQPNPDLKWETSTTTNAGIDFGFLNDRFFGAVDYFYKKTTDVLFEQDVAQPGPSGQKYWINLPGFIINKGIEVSLNTALIRESNMNWNFGVNASFLTNKVEGIQGFYETGGLHGQGISGSRAQRLVSGQPLNTFYLARFQGIDKSSGQGIYEGGDPSINKFYVGSPNPKTLLGINTEFQYRKVTATVNLNGAFGHYLYNNTANTVLPIGNLGTRNIAKALLNAEVQESQSNPITPSTRYLEKGNYLKLANATLAYSLGNINNTFRNATIALTGQNLLVFTDFTGFDPEVNTDKQVGGIPSLGIEYTPYPTARTILLSLSISL